MVISEVTMARLNYCNVLCHFSHSGCDDMADNSCHFGLNNFFADNLSARATRNFTLDDEGHRARFSSHINFYEKV